MKMRMSLLSCFVLVLTATLIVSTALASSKSSQNFVQEATVSNQFEISSSRLALQNSQNDDVKQFAQQMVDDHTQIGNRLKAVISSSNSELKEPAITLDQKHQNLLDRLNKLSGAAFDKEYVKEQVTAHDGAVSLFQKYAKSGDNNDLKTFAKETLPTLQEHQQAIHKLDASF